MHTVHTPYRRTSSCVSQLLQIVNTYLPLLAQSGETMKISTISYTLLSIVSAVAAETSGVEDVPFYLKSSETDPNSVIAVVYYGEMGDESKEIEVPCTMMSKTNSADKFVGPESMTCQCEAIRRGCGWGSSSSHTKVINNSKCQLHVPFQFEHNGTNGTISSVTFYKDNTNSADADDILIVPFYPQKDSEGNIIAVDVSAYNAAQQSSSSSPTAAAISLLLWFIILVGSIFVLIALVRIVRNGKCCARPNATTTTTTTTGVNPMNIKNMADLETPQRRRDDDDDDTATDDSKSDN